MKTSKQKIISYVIIVGVILAVAGLGSLFVNLGMDWFNTLDRPSDFVSNVFIPIMWTIIYGVYMVVLCIWTSKTTIPKNVKIWLIINAILNVLWWFIPKYRERAGCLTGLFFMLYALFRFALEFFREPDAHLGFIFENLTMGQILCIPMFLLGLLIIVRVSPRYQIHKLKDLS